MEEDSPWGAPSFPPSSPAFHLDSDHSPRLSPSVGSALPNSSWGADYGTGGGWGSHDPTEEYGAFGTASSQDENDQDERSGTASLERKDSVRDDAWGSSDAASDGQLPNLAPPIAASSDHDEPTLSTRHDDSFEHTSEEAHNRPEEQVQDPEDHDVEDDRGWAPSTPPLPPIASLHISEPLPASPVGHAEPTWEPSSFDDESNLAGAPPPLPSVNDLFSSSQSTRDRRESVGEGEEAWGAAQGWEERQEKEQERERELEEEERREIERKVREAEEAAERGEESWGTTARDPSAVDAEPARPTTSMFDRLRGTSNTAPSNSREGMSSIEASEKGHKGDEFDLDAPERNQPAKSSWWGRSTAEKKEVEDDPNTVGVQEVGQGEPGKVEEQSTQQVGKLGRLFGRFRKQTPTAATATEGGGESARSIAEQPRPTLPQQAAVPTFKEEDFDALSAGRLGGPMQSQVSDQREEEDFDVGGSFYGGSASGRGSFTNRSRVPTAPPEDDFGGLLGAFSTAPAQSRPSKPRTAKAYDPFDPLSESPTPVVSAGPATGTRPMSSFAPPPSVTTASGSKSTGDDSFDAFFDSVTSSIPKPPLSSIPTPPLPPQAPRPASLIQPRSSSNASSTKRSSVVVSPIPRMSSASPTGRPVGTLGASTVPSRSSTPILPLAPPPPPSQPLAQRHNLLGSLAPPPGPSRPVSTSPPPVHTSNPVVPLRASPASGPTARPPAAPARGDSGPLSRSDLDFFENL
ncbi:uncharacterized protein JCM15063_003578 [Sporobolomyces koalae]|uniref:uncharacterized protein n=1 Tax=Sporobolomyces koalae TaxID=500713 RepID=UPI00317B3E55